MPVLPVGGADVAASGSRARPPPIVLYERFEDRVRPKSYRVILSPVGGARVAVRRYVPELVLALSVDLRSFASGIRMTTVNHPTGFGINPIPHTSIRPEPRSLAPGWEPVSSAAKGS